jgi:hypothetical protein
MRVMVPPMTRPAAGMVRAARDWKRLAVSASAEVSLALRPSGADWVAVPAWDSCGRWRRISPATPPLADMVARKAAPDPVPGSTKARSRKRAIGQKQATSMMTQPTTAIPMFAAVSGTPAAAAELAAALAAT